MGQVISISNSRYLDRLQGPVTQAFIRDFVRALANRQADGELTLQIRPLSDKAIIGTTGADGKNEHVDFVEAMDAILILLSSMAVSS